ncbi:acyl-CoA dehydrogenase family protein [Catenulispora subtropica]|uniref:Acyl-CoA dehydrogenase family protein n=1 Tax=Catenulispora subtropica TaxID=450798 RepID=A0ABN2TD06_9ACTN
MRAPHIDYQPAIDPAEIRKDPEVCFDILRDAVAWLAANAAHLPGGEQIAVSREVGIRSGLYACQFPVEAGGGSVPERIIVALREEAAAVGRQYARKILSGLEGPSWVLLEGTPAQQEKWLRPLIDGVTTRCLAMTEERGGSDLTRVQTRAVRRDGTWVLSGRKYLISNAARADVAIVLARAEGDAGEGPTMFVLGTDTPGWKVVRELPGMDAHVDQYEVELDGVELGDDAVIGGLDRVGGGAGLASEYLPYGRTSMAARAVGMARYALGVARRHAEERVVFGVPLSEKQFIREFIVRSDVKIEAARCLVRLAADAIDRDRLAVREAAMAKLYATEAACEVVDDAMQVLGGRGWLVEFGLEQLYREVRLMRIVDGTSEMLKETVFNLPPTTPRMAKTARAARAAKTAKTARQSW